MSLARRMKRRRPVLGQGRKPVGRYSEEVLALAREWGARCEGLYSRRARRRWERAFAAGGPETRAERRGKTEAECSLLIERCEAVGQRLVAAGLLKPEGLGR